MYGRQGRNPHRQARLHQPFEVVEGQADFGQDEHGLELGAVDRGLNEANEEPRYAGEPYRVSARSPADRC